MVGAKRAVFLDRDGVIVIPEFRDGRSFAPRRVEDFNIYPEAPAALARLRAAGFALVVVTNQPDVAGGLITSDVLETMHDSLKATLPIDRIEVCTHRNEDRCECRKPAPGMLLQAADALELSLETSYMVGDRASDVEAGKRAGCKTVFIDRYYKNDEQPQVVNHSCGGIVEATDWILSD